MLSVDRTIEIQGSAISPPSKTTPDFVSPPIAKRPYTGTILALAILPRLAVVYFVLTHYGRGWLFGEGRELGYLGRLLALGRGFNSPFGPTTGPTAFLAPGYPFVISIFFRLFGIYSDRSAAAILLMHAAFGVATVALVIHIAFKTLGARTANVAGLCWALSPTVVWIPVIFWDTSASAMLLTGMVALALRLSRGAGLLLWSAAGVYCGLTILINPSLFLALLVILSWAAFECRRTYLRAAHPDNAQAPLAWALRPAAAVLVMLAVFAPWPIRNQRMLHAFIPFRSNLGYELWNGNQHGGNGRFVPALHPVLNQGQMREYAALGEVSYMREKTQLGVALIRAYPVEFLRHTAWRIPAFWFGLSQGEEGNSGLVTAQAVATTCLSFGGLWLLFRKNSRLGWLFLLPLLVFPLPYYLTHPDFRFRLLLDPMMVALAAYALTEAWAGLQRRLTPAARAPHVWR